MYEKSNFVRLLHLNKSKAVTKTFNCIVNICIFAEYINYNN